MVPASMITAARLLEPHGGRWIRLVAFAPYATLLYAAALLLLAVAALAGRGFWRPLCASACLLVLPLFAVHLWWASGPYVGQPAAAAAYTESFTVMSSNLSFGRADPADVVEAVVEHEVDILVLTEVTPEAVSQLRDAGLDKAFPHVRGEADQNVSGTMVFSGFRLGDLTRLDTSSAGYEMTVALPGQPIRLLAVHPRPPKGDARDWRADHIAVRRAAGSSREPTVIAGDFNATTDHLPMRELEGRGFADAADQARSGWQPTWPAAGELSVLGVSVPSMLAIDHVLLTEQLVATHTESVTISGTDHRAVVATLSVR